MPKKHSRRYRNVKSKKQERNEPQIVETLKNTERPQSQRQAIRRQFAISREKVWARKRARVRLHQSFHRSYREDYDRKLEVPGLIHHAASTFKIIFKNWQLFLRLLIILVILNIALVGLMSESTYQQFQNTLDETSEAFSTGEISGAARAGLMLIASVTTGGLNQGMTDAQQIFAILLFLVTWLVTIYLLRHRIAGRTVRVRDGLYNGLAPLLSTLCILLVLLVQAIPIMIAVIAYTAAIATDFLSTPFYALIFFIFAALLCLLSGYLISSSFLAFVAVSAPGLYPYAALQTASDLIAGRRIRLIIRLIYLVFVLAVSWIVVMLPIILIEMWLKSCFEWLSDVPIVPFFLLCMTTFSVIYATAYCYLFYRRMLDYEEE